MKNEYIRSVSWFGGLARAYRTVNSRRLFFLGVAALMMAALFAAQAISGPSSALGQDTVTVSATGEFAVSAYDTTEPGAVVAKIQGDEGTTVIDFADNGNEDELFGLESVADDVTVKNLVLAAGKSLTGGETYTVTVDLMTKGTDAAVVATITVTALRTTEASGTQASVPLGEGTARTVRLGPLFTYPEADTTITYDIVSSRSNIVRFTLTNSSLRLIGVQEGITNITVTASDGFGGSATQTFQVRVQAGEAPDTPTPVPTETPIPPTVTPTPEATETPTPEPTATVAIPTPTPTATPVPTATPEPTETPEPTATIAPAPTPTATETPGGGIGAVGIILVLAVLGILGGGGYYLYMRSRRAGEAGEGAEEEQADV